MKKTKKTKKVLKKLDEDQRKPLNKTRIRNRLIYLFSWIAIIAVFFFVVRYFLGQDFSLVMTITLTVFVLFGTLLDRPKKTTRGRKILRVLLIIFLVLIILALIGGCGFIVYVVKNAPDFETELLNKKESSIIYDKSGNELTKLGIELRENIEYDQTSEAFIDALIATEDSRFFQHNGFDLPRFLKASVGQVLNKVIGGMGNAGGGSTLTMQVVKNTFTSSEKSGIEGIIRKFTDIYISIFQLEKNYTKEQIIEFYINNHSIYGITFGIQEGSEALFGKEAKDLTLTEAAIAVGLYQSPTSYNPFVNEDAAEDRRNTVLYQMYNHGYISKEEWEIAKSIPISSLLNQNGTSKNPYQGYIDYVCDEIQTKYGIDPLRTPVLIYTNMDKKVQDGINRIMNDEVFKWKDADMQAGVAVIRSKNGAIAALGTGRKRVGAKNYSYATFSSSTLRQIGSTAKPLFDYGPGIEYNNWSTYTIFDDAPYTYSNGRKISNWDGGYKGKITLRTALAQSRNIPALKAFQQVDNKKIVDFVTTVGITPEISDGIIHEAHSIGAFTGASPLIMAGAYQIFSNGGYYYEPFSIHTIQLRDTGEYVIKDYEPTKVKVISPQTAYMITDILKGVTIDRSGLGKDKIAVKTGTTNLTSVVKRKHKLPDYAIRDIWADAYTHDTVFSMWIGYDEVKMNGHFLNFNTDGKYRNRLFNAVAKAAFSHDGKDFKNPGGISKVGVEKGSNPAKLPSANTPKDQIVYELFKKGTEPTETSTKYLSVSAPANISAAFNANGSVTVTWTKVANPEFSEDPFGYFVYYNDILKAFTQNTSITLSDGSGKGTYQVRAGYQVTKDGKSTPANLSEVSTYVLKSSYTLSRNGAATSTYSVGDSIPSHLYDGSMVLLKDSITGARISNPTINKTITNKTTGSVVSSIDSSKAAEFEIVYKVSYDGFQGQISNVIIIKGKETPPPEPQPEPDDDQNN